MNSRRGNWSTTELERLKLLYPRSPTEHVARVLRRSVASVQRRAERMLRSRPRRGSWTAGEDLRLRLAFGAVEVGRIALLLGRSQREVRERAERLRGQRGHAAWTAAEYQLLKRLYGNRADQDLEVCLQRPADQVVATARQLCLRKDKRWRHGGPRPMPRWSGEEVRRLRELYPGHDNLEIARILGRSVASVANKASQLGLHKSSALLERIGRTNVRVRFPTRTS
jgi:hypothetical protein